MASSDSSRQALTPGDVALQNNIERPDFTGWLYDVGSKQRRWCVLADMLLCIFLQKEDSVPAKVILVSGSRIIRVLCNTAKHDTLDPMRLVGVKVAGHLSSMTTSGLSKYQFVIEDCFSKTECVFAADSEALLDKWILMLRLASQPDVDAVCDLLNADVSPSVNRCPGKMAGLPEKSRNFSKVSSDAGSVDGLPKYVPTTGLRKHRLLCQDSTFQCERKEQIAGKVMFSKVIRQNGAEMDYSDDADDGSDSIGDHDNDDVDDDVDRIDDICPEHLTGDSLPAKKSTKLRRQGSFELFKDFLHKKTQVRSIKAKTKDTDSVTHQEKLPDVGDKSSHDVQSTDDEIFSVCLSGSFSDQSQLCSYTTSVDSSSGILPSFAQRIASKASNIRGKLKNHHKRHGVEHSDCPQAASDCRISGRLLYKQVLRWSKVWCVLSGGCLYVFRRCEDKMPMISAPLLDCSLSAVEHDKFTRRHVFRVCQLSARSLYFQAEEHNFQRWFDILKEETSTYESFQPTLPLYPELFDEGLQRTSLDLDGVSKNQSQTPEGASIICESPENVSRESNGTDCDEEFNRKSSPGVCLHKQTTRKQLLSRGESRGFIRDLEMPSKFSTTQAQSGYTCWSLDNYFEQHYLNKVSYSMSCESLDSWSSQSLLDGDVFDPDTFEQSLCDLSSGWENATSQLFPQLSSSLQHEEGKHAWSGQDTIFNRHLPGPNNEGLLLVTDDCDVGPNCPVVTTTEVISDRCVTKEVHQMAAPDGDKQVN